MSCPAPPAGVAALALAPAESPATACGWISQLNLPGRCTMSVPLARSISRPCGSASVCRKLVRSVCRLSRYLSSGVGPALAGAVAGGGVGVSAASAAAPGATLTSAPRSHHHLAASTSVIRRRWCEHIACAIRLQRTDESCELHGLEQPRGAVVTD